MPPQEPLTGHKPVEWEDIISDYATKEGIPPSLALAVARRESTDPTTGKLNPDAIGDNGEAVGLFQLHLGAAQDTGTANRGNPLENIRGGVRYLKQLNDRYGGDVAKTLQAYNGGGENVDAGTVSPEAQKYAADVIADISQQLRTAKPKVGQPASAPVPQPTQAMAATGITGTPVARFLSQAARAGIVEPVSGIASVARGMWNDPKGTIVALGKGLTEPTIRELQAATAAREAGDATAWVNHMLAAVPVIGPLSAELAKPFDEGDIAGGLGRMAGTAATFAVPKALGAVKESKLSEGAIPLLRSERTGSGFSQFLEHTAERTVAGRAVFRRFRERQQAALQQAGDNLATELSGTRMLGDTDTALQVRGAINRSLEERKAVAGQLYDQIDAITASETKRVPVTKEVPSKLVGPYGEPLTTTERSLKKVEVGGVQPETRVLKQVAIPMLRRIQQEGALLPPQELQRTTALLQRIVKSPKRVPFRAFQDARSDLLSIVRSHGDPLPGKAGGAAKMLAEQADQAMMSAARASGIDGLPEMIRQANDLWRESKTVFNAPFIEKILKDSPETIPALIRAADIDELRLLKKAVPADAFKVAQARVVRDMFELATEPAQRIGPTEGLLEAVSPLPTAPAQTFPQLSGKAIRRELIRMGPDKAEELFTKAGVEGLDEIADLAERVKPQDANRVAGGLVAAGVNARIISGLVWPGRWLTGGPVQSAALYGTINVLSRLLTKPEGITSARRFMRGIATGNRPLAIAAGLRLTAQYDELTKDDDNLLVQRPVAAPQ